MPFPSISWDVGDMHVDTYDNGVIKITIKTPGSSVDLSVSEAVLFYEFLIYYYSILEELGVTDDTPLQRIRRASHSQRRTGDTAARPG